MPANNQASGRLPAHPGRPVDPRPLRRPRSRVFLQAERAYRYPILMCPVVHPGEPVVPQIKEWFKSHEITPVEGWKVDLSREFKRRALSARVDAFDHEALKRWTELFNTIAPPAVAGKHK